MPWWYNIHINFAEANLESFWLTVRNSLKTAIALGSGQKLKPFMSMITTWQQHEGIFITPNIPKLNLQVCTGACFHLLTIRMHFAYLCMVLPLNQTQVTHICREPRLLRHSLPQTLWRLLHPRGLNLLPLQYPNELFWKMMIFGSLKMFKVQYIPPFSTGITQLSTTKVLIILPLWPRARDDSLNVARLKWANCKSPAEWSIVKCYFDLSIQSFIQFTNIAMQSHDSNQTTSLVCSMVHSRGAMKLRPAIWRSHQWWSCSRA